MKTKRTAWYVKMTTVKGGDVRQIQSMKLNAKTVIANTQERPAEMYAQLGLNNMKY